MTLKTVAILGSVREGRQGMKAAKFVVNALKEKGHEVVFVDPDEYDLPLLKKRYMDYEKGQAPEKMEKLSKLFSEADAFVLITAEYNHGIPSALKNTLDHFYKEYFWKPSAIVSYSMGAFGGVRASIQLREVVAELGMPSIRSVLTIGKIHEVLDGEGKAKDEKLNEKVGKFLVELEWYADALKIAREKGTPE